MLITGKDPPEDPSNTQRTGTQKLVPCEVPSPSETAHIPGSGCQGSDEFVLK